MKHTNAEEMSTAPSQSEANSTLAVAHTASTSVNGSTRSPAEDDRSTAGTAASRRPRAAATAALGRARVSASLTP